MNQDKRTDPGKKFDEKVDEYDKKANYVLNKFKELIIKETPLQDFWVNGDYIGATLYYLVDEIKVHFKNYNDNEYYQAENIHCLIDDRKNTLKAVKFINYFAKTNAITNNDTVKVLHEYVMMINLWRIDD